MSRAIVISRNGRTTVITGWRAWVIVAVASLIAAMTLVILTLLLLGVAITAAGLLVFVLPLALVIAAIGATQTREPER